MSLAIKKNRATLQLHGHESLCPGTFFESEALGPGITFIFDESGWSAESRARRLGFIEDEYLVLAPAAQAYKSFEKRSFSTFFPNEQFEPSKTGCKPNKQQRKIPKESRQNHHA
ncbi:MAG: hypothetical protein IJX93_03945 [Clostridia bacterium]|nr:hypothetical protein [Clostridia bacterium]MBQ8370193.1 hypothetical protein [Clostridia bacterium]MBQ8513223.1 hypothetical protein [Clostridia bacterium]